MAHLYIHILSSPLYLHMHEALCVYYVCMLYTYINNDTLFFRDDEQLPPGKCKLYIYIYINFKDNTYMFYIYIYIYLHHVV